MNRFFYMGIGMFLVEIILIALYFLKDSLPSVNAGTIIVIILVIGINVVASILVFRGME